MRRVGLDPLTTALLSAEEREFVHLTDDVLIAVDKSAVLPPAAALQV